MDIEELKAESHITEAIRRLKKENLKEEEKLGDLYNLQALKLMRTGKYEAAFDFLKRAEQLKVRNKEQLYNNLGCYYKHAGEYRVALMYFKKALEIERTGDCEINISVVLSALHEHQAALREAMFGVIQVEEDMIFELVKNNKKIYEEKSELLSVGFHNIGTQLEWLNRKPDSTYFYEISTRLHKQTPKFEQKSQTPTKQRIIRKERKSPLISSRYNKPNKLPIARTVPSPPPPSYSKSIKKISIGPKFSLPIKNEIKNEISSISETERPSILPIKTTELFPEEQLFSIEDSIDSNHE